MKYLKLTILVVLIIVVVHSILYFISILNYYPKAIEDSKKQSNVIAICTYLSQLPVGTPISTIEKTLSLPNSKSAKNENLLYNNDMFEYSHGKNIIKIGVILFDSSQHLFNGDYELQSKANGKINICSNVNAKNLRNCPESISSEELRKLRSQYGDCDLYKVSNIYNCKGIGNYYLSANWKDSVIDNQGGVVVFSDSYVFLNKAFNDGSTLIKGNSLCFDQQGVHSIKVK